jgi:exopolysaccharide biosynthesis WecB/TagA/CpsF family protein
MFRLGAARSRKGKPEQFLADALERHFHEATAPLAVTWLNHYTLIQSDAMIGGALREFDVVGVDGKLLQILSGVPFRTSADLVLPLLLPRCSEARVAVVGGSPQLLQRNVQALRQLLPATASVVVARDGFQGRPSNEELSAILKGADANLALVALGGGLQDATALSARSAMRDGIVFTCGGFLDQLAHGAYYPAWAYALRLNWLIRLAREPRRLWRRYSVDAVTAVVTRQRLARIVKGLPGVDRHNRYCSGQGPAS